MSQNITDCEIDANCNLEEYDDFNETQENPHHIYLAVVPPVTVAFILMVMLGVFFVYKSKKLRQKNSKRSLEEQLEEYEENQEVSYHIEYEETESSNTVIDSATEISSIMSGDLSSLDHNALYMHTVQHYGSSSSDDEDKLAIYTYSHTP